MTFGTSFTSAGFQGCPCTVLRYLPCCTWFGFRVDSDVDLPNAANSFLISAALFKFRDGEYCPLLLPRSLGLQRNLALLTLGAVVLITSILAPSSTVGVSTVTSAFIFVIGVVEVKLGKRVSGHLNYNVVSAIALC